MAETENDQEQLAAAVSEDENEAAEEKLKCSVSVEDCGPWQKKISITVPRDEIDAALESQFQELKKTADVPGFRKGRAPLRLLEKRFGTDVSDQAKFRLLARAFEQVDEEQNFEVLGEPDLDPESITLPDTGDFTFDYEVEVKPEFDLPDLEGVRIEKPFIEIGKERIDEALEELLRRYGQTIEITDKPAVADDLIYADVTIKVEGVEEPEVLENTPIRVGQAALAGINVEDLPKGLTGAKVGQTKTCSAQAPDTHANEAYRGKKADFSIEVKTIQRSVPAELNAEFFETIGAVDEAQLRGHLADELEGQAEREVRQVMGRQVSEYLGNQITFDLPPGVAARHSARVLQRRYYELLNMGVEADRINEVIEKLKASTAGEATAELKMNFIMEAVTDKLEITASEAEINGWIAQMAVRNNRRPEKVRDELRSQGRLGELHSQICIEKAIDRILEMAEVVDAPPPKPEPTEEKPKKQRAPRKTAKKVAKKAENKADDTNKDQAPKKNSTRKQVKRKPPASDE